MAKFCGKIGYGITREDTDNPGIWISDIVERSVYGDVISNYRSLENSNEINDNINISAKVSFIADPYAYSNYQFIKYVEFNGTKWKATIVDPSSYPRLIVTLGGIYNGE